jgi:hypothetical protein
MAKNNFMNAMMKAELPQSMFSQDEKIKNELIILENLKKFIPPLAPDERQLLEQNILKFGCKDPLLVWETSKGVIDPTTENPNTLCYVLVDGHNRHEICNKFKLDFRINLIEFPNMGAAQDFMIDHQLGRRNLSLEQMAYLRGMKYLSLKQERDQNNLVRDNSGKFKTEEKIEIHRGGQNDHYGESPSEIEQINRGGQSDHYGELSSEMDLDNRGGQNDHHGKNHKLSEQLAKEFNVGEKTIRRDADFARGIELLPTEIKNEVLQGKSTLKKSDIIEIGKTKDFEEANQKIQALTNQKEDNNKQTKKDLSPNEKVLNLVKPYLITAEACDMLIAEIKSIKKGILKN